MLLLRGGGRRPPSRARRWGIAFAWGGGGLLIVAAALAGLAWLFLAKPGLFVNDRTGAFAARRLAWSWAPSWGRLSVSAEAADFARHRYVLLAEGLCVASPSRGIDGCFDRVELAARVDWTRRGPLVRRIERLTVLGRRLRAASKGGKKPGKGPPRLPSALAGARLEQLRVELPGLELSVPKGAFTGSFWARLSPGLGRPLAAGVDGTVRAGGRPRRALGRASATFEGLVPGAPLLDAEAWARVDGGPSWAASVRARRDGPNEAFAVMSATVPAARVSGAWRLRRAAPGWTAAGALAVAPRRGPVRALALDECRARLRGERTLRAGAASLACRWRAELAPLASPLAPRSPLLSGTLSLDGGLDDGAWSASADAAFDPAGDWYSLKGGVRLRASKRTNGPVAASHNVDATLELKRFGDLVKLLDGGRFEIPAPLRTLDGPLFFSALSEGDPRAARQRATWRARSELTGGRQRLRASAEGTAAFTRRLPGAEPAPPEVDASVLLRDAAFELPRLGLVGLPRPTLDRRIKGGQVEELPPPAPKAVAKPRAKLPLVLRASVRTEQPVRLFSNLAKDAVPISLDLTLASPPPGARGLVAVKSFGIELFRRNAIVDHFNLRLRPGSRSADIEGLVRYSASGANIRIILLGTTEKPRVHLESDPPMDRQQIISLLVYGKTPSELDLEENASVGNTQTALESQAFGLVSLLLFGATPVERVAYDSASGTYLVRLRLPGGANMELASDFTQNRELRVRKLLAPHWAVESEVRATQGPNSQSQAEPPAAYLEWFMRY